MPRTSDLVNDSKLETIFIGHDTRHISYRSIAKTQQRKIRVEERWRREEKIGDGSHGQVWLEKCYEGPKEGELRAVKKIPKRQMNKTQTSHVEELEAITKFSQAKSFGWYEDESSVYIAMEYMEHGDLQQRLTQPFLETEVRSIASQLLDGLQFMHENGFAHRDLKPSNILVLHQSPVWWVKIGDFGISKRVEDGTYLRTVIGTRGYLAPEIIGIFPIEYDTTEPIEKESYTSAIDIWALGEICFKMITKRPVFPTRRTLFDYVVRGLDFPYAPLHKYNASIDCINFIEMTMSALAADRPSAREALTHVWMKVEEARESDGRSPSMERQADVTSLKDSRSFEATAEWSTLSGSVPIRSKTLGANLHIGDSILSTESHGARELDENVLQGIGSIQSRELEVFGADDSNSDSSNASFIIVKPLQSSFDHRGPESPQCSTWNVRCLKFPPYDPELSRSEDLVSGSSGSDSMDPYPHSDAVTAIAATEAPKVNRKSRSRRIIEKAIEKTIRPDKKHKSKNRTRPTSERDIAAKNSSRRMSSQGGHKESLVSSADSSAISFALNPRHRSYDSMSSSKVSINDPKLLETVEDAIRSLIRPKLESLPEGSSKVSINDPELLETVEDTIRELIRPKLESLRREREQREAGSPKDEDYLLSFPTESYHED